MSIKMSDMYFLTTYEIYEGIEKVWNESENEPDNVHHEFLLNCFIKKKKPKQHL